jgi:FKBP-type peptidyl-prolyl cis-trans isomerase
MWIFALAFTQLWGESLTADGKVTKVVLRSGIGPRPVENDVALIHYSGSFANGITFDSSFGRGGLEFTIGKGVISGWSIGVQTMQVGEISNFTIHYEYGYGEHGYPPVIPAKAQLHFQIELMSFTR